MPSSHAAARDLEDRLHRLNDIGMALSAERDLNVLLERIVQEARRFTRADAGSLYLVHEDRLEFQVAQNDSLKSFVGGRRGQTGVPPVPLDRSSVSGYVAVTGETLNIADVYTDRRYRFEGPQQYDRISGYRTRSMLVVPMRDHEHEILGVLQLINALDPDTGKVQGFTDQDESLIQSLASQAAVAINNVRLVRDTEALFEAFVQVMATAIDERSPYTGGHIRRVAEVTMILARAVNACNQGPLAGIRFTESELDELRVAAWMHDIGKITTPEWVVDKPTKLSAKFDRIELLRTRYACIREATERELLQRQLDGENPDKLDAERRQRLQQLEADLEFLERANRPGEFMEDADVERLQEIAAQHYTAGERNYPRLTSDELTHLSIRKGSLTEAERKIINDHAVVTIKMLEQIPFTRKLSRVPEIAGSHHEKLDGSGYPQGLRAEQISLQARILALVDVFESLSAADRPYKNGMSPETVLRILEEEVQANHLDGQLLELLVNQRLFQCLEDIKERMLHRQNDTV